MKRGDVVWILAGEEAGCWGVVDMVQGGEHHVAHAGGSLILLFERDEIRRPRDQAGARQALGLPKLT